MTHFQYRLICALLGAASLGALLTGCGSADSATTPKQGALAPLHWQSLPGRYATVAPSDGLISYWCQIEPGADSGVVTQPAVFVSRDYWKIETQVGVIPATDINANCDLSVDQAVSTTLIATLSYIPHGQGAPDPAADHLEYFVSFDGGATWRKTDRVGPTLTWHGTVYANGSDANQNELAISKDQMASWQAIIPIGAIGPLRGFWLDQTTGDLLAYYAEPPSTYGIGNADAVGTLWETPDNGAHWHALSTPPIDPSTLDNVSLFAYRQPHARFWHICAAYLQAGAAHIALMCSADTGKTWKLAPAITTAHSSDSSDPRVVGFASDGALLATQGAALYRLDSNLAQWQSLGQLPAGESNAAYTTLPSGDILWYMPNTMTPLSITGAPQP